VVGSCERGGKLPYNAGISLTLILLTWSIWRTPNNDNKWQMGFNSAFKGLEAEEILDLQEGI
jgi:hypothetical protein